MTAALNLRELIEDYNPADYAESGFYDECTGEFYPAHRAGDRNTKPPLPVYSFLGGHEAGDILVLLGRARERLVRVSKSPDDAWKVSTLQEKYEYFRMIAMRPSSRSRLLQAEMLALASRCEQKANALVAATRGDA